MSHKCFNCPATENLFRAPKSQEMRDRWLELFPEETPVIFDESFRICSEHFDNKFLLPNGGLSARAVPTKFQIHNVWCEIDDEDYETELEESLNNTLNSDEEIVENSSTDHVENNSSDLFETLSPAPAPTSKLVNVPTTTVNKEAIEKSETPKATAKLVVTTKDTTSIATTISTSTVATTLPTSAIVKTISHSSVAMTKSTGSIATAKITPSISTAKITPSISTAKITPSIATTKTSPSIATAKITPSIATTKTTLTIVTTKSPPISTAISTSSLATAISHSSVATTKSTQSTAKPINTITVAASSLKPIVNLPTVSKTGMTNLRESLVKAAQKIRESITPETAPLPVTTAVSPTSLPVTRAVSSTSLPVTTAASPTSLPVTTATSSTSLPVTTAASSTSLPVTTASSSTSLPVTRAVSSTSLPVSTAASSTSLPVTTTASSTSLPTSSKAATMNLSAPPITAVQNAAAKTAPPNKTTPPVPTTATKSMESSPAITSKVVANSPPATSVKTSGPPVGQLSSGILRINMESSSATTSNVVGSSPPATSVPSVQTSVGQLTSGVLRIDRPQAIFTTAKRPMISPSNYNVLPPKTIQTIFKDIPNPMPPPRAADISANLIPAERKKQTRKQHLGPPPPTPSPPAQPQIDSKISPTSPKLPKKVRRNQFKFLAIFERPTTVTAVIDKSATVTKSGRKVKRKANSEFITDFRKARKVRGSDTDSADESQLEMKKQRKQLPVVLLKRMIFPASGQIWNLSDLQQLNEPRAVKNSRAANESHSSLVEDSRRKRNSTSVPVEEENMNLTFQDIIEPQIDITVGNYEDLRQNNLGALIEEIVNGTPTVVQSDPPPLVKAMPQTAVKQISNPSSQLRTRLKRLSNTPKRFTTAPSVPVANVKPKGPVNQPLPITCVTVNTTPPTVNARARSELRIQVDALTSDLRKAISAENELAMKYHRLSERYKRLKAFLDQLTVEGLIMKRGSAD